MKIIDWIINALCLLFVTFILLVAICFPGRAENYLAPPPINFTKIEVPVNGKVYTVENHHNTITIEEKPHYKVVAEFAFYYYFEELSMPPIASFIVRESNHPRFPVGGNLGEDVFKEYEIEIPIYPSYTDWVLNGKKVVR